MLQARKGRAAGGTGWENGKTPLRPGVGENNFPLFPGGMKPGSVNGGPPSKKSPRGASLRGLKLLNGKDTAADWMVCRFSPSERGGI